MKWIKNSDMLWKDGWISGGWMDGSMVTSLKRGTSIDAITEISGVQRQFLGIRFCFDDLEEVSNLHAACIHAKFSYGSPGTRQPGDTPGHHHLYVPC